MKKRTGTKYPGVYYRTKNDAATGKKERVYYICYRLRMPDGSLKQHEETVGSQHRDNMTPAKAHAVRVRRMHGDEKPNRVRRSEARAANKKKAWTVSSLWVEYKKANPGLKSLAPYETLFNLYLAPLFGSKEPKAITAFNIDRLKHRKMKGKSDKSISNTLELLRRIVNFGVKRGLCTGPGFIIQLPRVNNQKTEDLNPEQMAKLLEVINSHIEYRTPYRTGSCMMKLALLTGMRRGEMFKLQWDDIDWHRKNIRLRDAKSGRDEIIPLSSHSSKLLKGIQETNDSEGPFVFPGKTGQLTDIKRQVNHIKAEAGLPADFRPLHGLRHVFASMLVSHGVSLDVVSRLLAHKGRSVTHRYSHIRDDVLMETAELAGRLLEEAARDHAIPLQGNAYKPKIMEIS
ncbi:MAG: tyrosine-type recombinase/integrase [Thermoleophilia bacterium]